MRMYFDTVIDKSGNVVPGATVSVTTAQGAPVQIYRDPDGTQPVSNPINAVTTNALGLYSFYVPNGTYSLTQSFHSGTAAVVQSVQIYDLKSLPNAGPSTPVSGSTIAADYIFGSSSIIYEGGIWSGPVYVGYAFDKTFVAGGGGSPSPSMTMFVRAVSDGSTRDVVPLIATGLVKQSNGIAFGGNFIARSEAGLSNVTLAGLEVDWEPATGTAINSGSIGIILNAFAAQCPVAMQVGGASFGGSYGNGTIYSANVAGTLIGVQAGYSIGSAIDTFGANWAENAPYKTRNTHRIKFYGPSSSSAHSIYSDTSGNLRIVNAATNKTISVRDATDGVNVVTITDAGDTSVRTLGLVSFTVATVPSAALLGDRVIISVANGNAGQPCLAVSQGGQWKAIPLGPNISAS